PVVDVLPAGGFHLEAEHDVEQRTDPALHFAGAAGGRIDAGQHAQQRALAGAIVPEDADAITVVQAQIDAIQRPHFDVGVYRTAIQVMNQVLLQGDAALVAHPELQRDVVQYDAGHATANSPRTQRALPLSILRGRGEDHSVGC